MISQLRKDLHNHIDNRLYRWVKDSAALYHMAELDPNECATDMVISMFAALGAVAAAFELDHDRLVEAFTKSLVITLRAARAQEESR